MCRTEARRKMKCVERLLTTEWICEEPNFSCENIFHRCWSLLHRPKFSLMLALKGTQENSVVVPTLTEIFGLHASERRSWTCHVKSTLLSQFFMTKDSLDAQTVSLHLSLCLGVTISTSLFSSSSSSSSPLDNWTVAPLSSLYWYDRPTIPSSPCHSPTFSLLSL